MENRRPIRVQKKEDILKYRSPQDPLHPCSEVTSEEAENSSEARPDKKREETNRTKKINWVVLAVVVAGALWISSISRRQKKDLRTIEKIREEIEKRMQEIEYLIKSKSKDNDVADFLEGARIIHEITTPVYRTKWGVRTVIGGSAELAIDKVCTKGHCYSFSGSEGKIAVGFRNEKLIKKIGISHPNFDNRASAVRKFTVDCIVNNREQKVGDFEYEVPGDSFQQFSIAPIKCTGIVLRIKSNHGNKEYTCVYKIHAFE